MATIYDKLVIRSMRLRNRLALPPLTSNSAGEDGRVTEAVLRFYAERAKHVGLVIVEATAIRPDGRLVRGSLGLWEEGQVAGMALLSDCIRKLGAAAVVQLNHAGARCAPTGGGMQGASPSGFRFRPDVTPFAMSRAQIDEMVGSYAQAAGRAVAAGFDGVEIHGAHLCLVSQFLSPLTNTRDDRYGGEARGRATFALEVVEAVGRKVGQDYPILFRINAEERVDGGLTVEDAITAGRLLAENGIDCLDVSVVAGATWGEEDGRRFLTASSALPKETPAGANVLLAAKMKRETGLPVIAVGKLAEGRAAEEAVTTSDVDIVAIGRQMIADPDAARKILAGEAATINRCKQCMNCFASIRREGPVSCKVLGSAPK